MDSQSHKSLKVEDNPTYYLNSLFYYEFRFYLLMLKTELRICFKYLC